MTKSRIAIFQGYAAPRSMSRYGAQLFDNPRQGRGGSLGRPSLGRRSYYVPAAYPPDRPHVAYKVKRKRNTPAMKKAMSRFTKAAKLCSRKTRNSRKSGAYQACMRKTLKKSKR